MTHRETLPGDPVNHPLRSTPERHETRSNHLAGRRRRRLALTRIDLTQDLAKSHGQPLAPCGTHRIVMHVADGGPQRLEVYGGNTRMKEVLEHATGLPTYAENNVLNS